MGHLGVLGFPLESAVSSSPEETRLHLESLLGHEAEWQELSRRGVNSVLEKHTYRHRLQTVFEMLGRELGRPGEAVAP